MLFDAKPYVTAELLDEEKAEYGVYIENDDGVYGSDSLITLL